MIAAAILVLLALAVPAFNITRYRLARRSAQRVLPRSGEVWMQDGQALYVIRSTNTGLVLQLSGTGVADQWSESWTEWAARVRNRSVLRTDVRWKLDA